MPADKFALGDFIVCWGRMQYSYWGTVFLEPYLLLSATVSEGEEHWIFPSYVFYLRLLGHVCLLPVHSMFHPSSYVQLLTHTFAVAFGRQADLYRFKVSLVYIEFLQTSQGYHRTLFLRRKRRKRRGGEGGRRGRKFLPHGRSLVITTWWSSRVGLTLWFIYLVMDRHFELFLALGYYEYWYEYSGKFLYLLPTVN